MTTSEENLAEEKGRILVVDDDELTLQALKMTLQREGYEVFTASSGTQAVDLMHKIPPALIICDQIMPEMSGIEVMKKAQELRPDAIRILLTASQDTVTAIDAINIGNVNKYLTKPWKEAQLRKTVKASLEKYKLVKENHVLQKLIFTQHKKLKKNHENLQHELKLSARIHEQLLLGKVPRDIPGFIVEALSFPSKEIDGDFFEFYRPSPHILDMVFGDVMGKGIAAALVGTAVKTQMIRFAMPFPYSQIFDHALGWHNNLLTPIEILTHVHHATVKQLIDLEYFVSLLYVRFDLQYKTLNYVDCGSAKPIHYKAKEKMTVELAGDNFPLGVVREANYSSKTTTFAEGDVFVFYSDGVTEALSPINEFFGTQRLIDFVKNNHDLRACALLDLIRTAVLSFTQKKKLDDDLTIVVIKIGYYDQPKLAQFVKTQFCCDLSQLQAVRDFIKGFCQKAPGDSERLANEMQLAINEVFCNIVKHGHIKNPDQPCPLGQGNDLSGRGLDPSHPNFEKTPPLREGSPNASPRREDQTIYIEGHLQEEGVFFKISDQGLPFDPSQVNDPSFCGNRDTGYGWHIIRELADKLSYTRKGTLQGWNHVCFFKRYYFGDGKMNLFHKTEDNVLVITPESESLDARDAPEFKEKVIELINHNNTHGVVFDLQNLQFIDSSGLGSFLSVLRVLNTDGGDLKLSHMNKPIRTMFELVKMHKIFEIFNSTEEAIRSFR